MSTKKGFPYLDLLRFDNAFIKALFFALFPKKTQRITGEIIDLIEQRAALGFSPNKMTINVSLAPQFDKLPNVVFEMCLQDELFVKFSKYNSAPIPFGEFASLNRSELVVYLSFCHVLNIQYGFNINWNKKAALPVFYKTFRYLLSINPDKSDTEVYELIKHLIPEGPVDERYLLNEQGTLPGLLTQKEAVINEICEKVAAMTPEQIDAANEAKEPYCNEVLKRLSEDNTLTPTTYFRLHNADIRQLYLFPKDNPHTILVYNTELDKYAYFATVTKVNLGEVDVHEWERQIELNKVYFTRKGDFIYDFSKTEL